MQVATKTRGRPTVFDSDTVHKLEMAFSIGCTVEEACLVSGISRSAYYKRIETDPDFMDKMERSKLFTIFMARKTVCQAILRGDVKTSMWYLERKRRDEFGKCTHGNRSTTVEIEFDELSYKDLNNMINSDVK